MTRSAVAFFCVVLHMAAATSASAQVSSYYWERYLVAGNNDLSEPDDEIPFLIDAGTLTTDGAGESFSVIVDHAAGSLDFKGHKGKIRGSFTGEVQWDERWEIPMEDWYKGTVIGNALLRLTYHHLFNDPGRIVTRDGDCRYWPSVKIDISGSGFGADPRDVSIYLTFTMTVDGVQQSQDYQVAVGTTIDQEFIWEPTFALPCTTLNSSDPAVVMMEVSLFAMIAPGPSTGGTRGNAGGNIDFSHTFQWLGAAVTIDGVPATGLTITDTDNDGTDWTGMVPAAQCTPDLNGDGILDNGDIQAFITLFLAGDLASDMNGDGILDNGDIQDFVTAFLAGCS